ncbi:MAG: YggS family pyridoxal phosphate-dependent enzyme [Alphaproteobacteria bacterium]
MSVSPSQPFDSAAALSQLRERIADAAGKAGRAPQDITLIGVSKVHGPERIAPVLDAGLMDFGENRVQEAQGKWPDLRARYPGIRLHLVGPLQTNKLDDALALFDVIHSVDREKLARKLAEALKDRETRPSLFIQVNTGEEPQKSGVLPREADAFITLCRDDLDLRVAGLMCLPPADEEPALHFALLAKIAERNGVSGLSMGMTGDFETAIAFGATHIRVGTALFGERPKPGREAAGPATGSQLG